MGFIFLSIVFNLHLQVSDSSFEKEFYRVFSFGNIAEVEKSIRSLESAGALHFSEAYKGAMLMKKSLLLKTPESKLKAFKAGYKLLEKEISKSSGNAELRFLRLAIQEHAPEFLKYNKDIKEDKTIIKKNFKALDAVVRDYIIKYCSVSSILKTTDFQ